MARLSAKRRWPNMKASTAISPNCSLLSEAPSTAGPCSSSPTLFWSAAARRRRRFIGSEGRTCGNCLMCYDESMKAKAHSGLDGRGDGDDLRGGTRGIDRQPETRPCEDRRGRL